MSQHNEKIKCPECSSIEDAIVIHAKTDFDWSTYIHDCSKCGYTIMESEWEEINPARFV